PEPKRLVVATRGQHVAVGGKGNGNDLSIVPAKDADFLALLNVPEPDGLILTARGDQLAFGREGDGQHCTLVSVEGEHLLAVGGVPHPDSTPRLAMSPVTASDHNLVVG